MSNVWIQYEDIVLKYLYAVYLDTIWGCCIQILVCSISIYMGSVVFEYNMGDIVLKHLYAVYFGYSMGISYPNICIQYVSVYQYLGVYAVIFGYSMGISYPNICIQYVSVYQYPGGLCSIFGYSMGILYPNICI